MFLLTMILHKIKQLFTTDNLISMIIAAFVYSTNTFVLKNYTSGSVLVFCRCYLNDLFCPFFIVAIARIMLAWAGIKVNSFIHIFLLGVAFGLFFEFIGPIINLNSVSDPLDFLCYCLGTIAYFFMTKLFTSSDYTF